jgi:hypothetical protein
MVTKNTELLKSIDSRLEMLNNNMEKMLNLMNNSSTPVSKEVVGTLVSLGSVGVVGKVGTISFGEVLSSEEKMAFEASISENYSSFLSQGTIYVNRDKTIAKTSKGLFRLNHKTKELRSKMLNSIYLDMATNEVVAEFKNGKTYKYFAKSLSTSQWEKLIDQLMNSERMSVFFRHEFIAKKSTIGYSEV